jgi:hypothetical protein
VIKSRWYQIGYTPIGLQSAVVAQLPDFSMLGIFHNFKEGNSDAEVLAHLFFREIHGSSDPVLRSARAVRRLLECAIKFRQQALADQRTSLFFRSRRRIGAFAFAVLKFRSGVLSLVVHYGYQFIRVASDDRAGA